MSNKPAMLALLTALNVSAAPAARPPPAPAVDSVTLHSVIIRGDRVVATYSKNFGTCVHMLTPQFQHLHNANWFCTAGNNVVNSGALSDFPSLGEGSQVQLCHGNNIGICSNAVNVIHREASAAGCVEANYWPLTAATVVATQKKEKAKSTTMDQFGCYWLDGVVPGKPVTITVEGTPVP